MPTLRENPILDGAKEAVYTAVGLNVLVLDEVSERLSGPRVQLEGQVDIARTHATKARTEWQKQADEFNESFKKRLPFDVEQLTERMKINLPFDADDLGGQVETALRSNVRRTWELTEPAITWVAGRTPAPLDEVVNDGVAKLRDLVTDLSEAAPAAAAAAPAKPATASKTAARKTAAKTTAARKAPAKKAPARKAAAPKAATPEA
jgi:hypothetical protein